MLLNHDYLSSLPDEKLLEVMSLLPIESIGRLCNANNRMRLLCEDQGIIDMSTVEKAAKLETKKAFLAWTGLLGLLSEFYDSKHRIAWMIAGKPAQQWFLHLRSDGSINAAKGRDALVFANFDEAVDNFSKLNVKSARLIHPVLETLTEDSWVEHAVKEGFASVDDEGFMGSPVVEFEFDAFRSLYRSSEMMRSDIQKDIVDQKESLQEALVGW